MNSFPTPCSCPIGLDTSNAGIAIANAESEESKRVKEIRMDKQKLNLVTHAEALKMPMKHTQKQGKKQKVTRPNP